MIIEAWLDQFKHGWKNKDVDAVMQLFTPDIIYYETPFRRLSSLDELRKEWGNIVHQQEIDLHFELFSREDDKYAIRWDLKYLNPQEQRMHFGGVYLIKLDENGLCTEFRHYCEVEKIAEFHSCL